MLRSTAEKVRDEALQAANKAYDIAVDEVTVKAEANLAKAVKAAWEDYNKNTA